MEQIILIGVIVITIVGFSVIVFILNQRLRELKN
jgi:hypothetical protein